MIVNLLIGIYISLLSEYSPKMQEELIQREETIKETYSITEEDLENLVMVTYAESRGESDLGKRLVIDTVLNRADSTDFEDQITDVIYEPNQYTSMDVKVGIKGIKKDEIAAKDWVNIELLILDEIENRTNKEVLYYRTKQYHKFGTPVIAEGNHYFSK